MADTQVRLPHGSVRQLAAGTIPAQLLDTTIDVIVALVDSQPGDLHPPLLADADWRGEETRPQLQRIGAASEDLLSHLQAEVEAERAASLPAGA